MYQPSHFVENDPAVLLPLLRAMPLATLVRGGGDAPLHADLVPLRVMPHAEGDARGGPGWHLAGHVARANPLWRDADGQEVLLVFHGPQAYVSPAWYASKAEHGKVVPTWNYATVQVRGRLRAIDDAAWLRAFVTGLTDEHEAGRADRWSVSDAPADFIDATLRAIVGLEIDVQSVEGKFKLSQNRPEVDRQGVVRGLLDDAAAGRQPQAADTAQAVQAAEARRPAAPPGESR
jgi:transcriptional regulator